MRHFLAPLALVIVAGCAIPARDNPYDPTNDLDVTFSVSPLDGSPHTPFTIQALTSRIDGVERWLDLDADGIFETPMDSGEESITRELAVPAGIFGNSGAGALDYTVSLEVRHDGPTIRASSDVRIHNAAPVLDIGPDVIVAAWEQPTVRLDHCGDLLGCPVPDPDGPAGLTYTWRQLAGTTVLPAPVVSSAATFVAPAAPQTLVFELTVDDGFAAVRQPLTVRVGRPAWVSSMEPSRLHRFHPDSRTYSFPALPPIIAASASPDGEVWMIVGDYSVDVWEAVRVSPYGDVLARWPLPFPDPSGFGGGGPVFGNGDTGGWAVVGVYDPSYHPELHHLPAVAGGSTSGTAVIVDPGFVIQQVTPDPGTPGGVIAYGIAGQAARIAPDGTVGATVTSQGLGSYCIANDGTIWKSFGSPLYPATTVVHVLSDGSEVDFDFDGSLIGLVPGSQGVLVALGEDGFLRKIIAISDAHEVAPALPTRAIDVTTTQVVGNGDGDVWLYHAIERTIRRLQPRASEFEVAAVAVLESLGIPYQGYQPFPFVSPDPWNGGLIVTGGDGVGNALYVRISPKISPFEQASPATVRMETDATRGAYWTEYFDTASGWRRYDTMGRVLGEFALPPQSDESSPAMFVAAPDGGLYVPTRFLSTPDSRIRRLAPDGTVVATVDIAGESIIQLGLDGDGELACLATTTLNGAVGHVRRVGETDFLTGAGVPHVVSTRSGACWGWMDSGAVAFAGETGTQVAPLTDAEFIAPDPYDDSAWVYDHETTRISHIRAPDGVELASFLTPVPLGPPVGLTPYRELIVTRTCDPSTAADRPECRELWMISDLTSPATVYRVDGFGNVTVSFTLSAGRAGWLDVR